MVAQKQCGQLCKVTCSTDQLWPLDKNFLRPWGWQMTSMLNSSVKLAMIAELGRRDFGTAVSQTLFLKLTNFPSRSLQGSQGESTMQCNESCWQLPGSLSFLCVDDSNWKIARDTDDQKGDFFLLMCRKIYLKACSWALHPVTHRSILLLCRKLLPEQ